jgi:orotate phosphoribosyltransferase
LQCRAAYTEKDGAGGMALKRGFSLKPGTRVLVVEDIITTGGSVKKTVAHLRQRGAEVVGVGVLIDRSTGEAQFDCPFTPLAVLPMESWPPEACKLCRQGVPLVDPDHLTG